MDQQQKQQKFIEKLHIMAKYIKIKPPSDGCIKDTDPFGESLALLIRTAFFNGSKDNTKVGDKSVWECIQQCGLAAKKSKNNFLSDRISQVNAMRLKRDNRTAFEKTDTLIRFFMQYGYLHELMGYFMDQGTIMEHYSSTALFASAENRKKIHEILQQFNDITVQVADTSDLDKKPLPAEHYVISSSTTQSVMMSPNSNQMMTQKIEEDAANITIKDEQLDIKEYLGDIVIKSPSVFDKLDKLNNPDESPQELQTGVSSKLKLSFPDEKESQHGTSSNNNATSEEIPAQKQPEFIFAPETNEQSDSYDIKASRASESQMREEKPSGIPPKYETPVHVLNNMYMDEEVEKAQPPLLDAHDAVNQSLMTGMSMQYDEEVIAQPDQIEPVKMVNISELMQKENNGKRHMVVQFSDDSESAENDQSVSMAIVQPSQMSVHVTNKSENSTRAVAPVQQQQEESESFVDIFFGDQNFESTRYVPIIKPDNNNITDRVLFGIKSSYNCEISQQKKQIKLGSTLAPLESKLVPFEKHYFQDAESQQQEVHEVPANYLGFDYRNFFQMREMLLDADGVKLDLEIKQPDFDVDRAIQAQHGICPGCSNLIMADDCVNVWFCQYSGMYYCSKCQKFECSVPGNIVNLRTDLECYVCKQAAKDISQGFHVPAVLNEILPFSTQEDPEFVQLIRLRKQLIVCYLALKQCDLVDTRYSQFITQYLGNQFAFCPKQMVYDPMDLKPESLLSQQHEHLGVTETAVVFLCAKTGMNIIKSVGYWSLKDFFEIKSGKLLCTIMNAFVRIEQHLMECKKCQAKLHKKCKCGKLASASGVDVRICSYCGSFVHEKCWGNHCYVCGNVE
ncbi:Conserved_hypothetical protein [Hexamita inflata]|uniref:RUN domain-containing protein n=1 Tax=Hexamita inflata TaxID=28002 RepID=A0AA86PDE0_9EUKA|nr:Conserved hypothetical protein [Hexamita inflata]